MKQDWQVLWNKRTTGKKIRDLLPLVSLHTTSWSRELCIFFTENGPFPEYLHRLRLSSSDKCNCGGVGSPLHYATSYPFTVSWHMSPPSAANELAWRKSVLKNKDSKRRICTIIQFIHHHSDLFKPLQ
ncbi:hypothetical protein AVEN_189712-1 [Araneus ventricosus]|uniref:Uncharacterized protein n=1 Tax=Araneus ventricosus TaxID=182803 RepID=A0A4Y2J1G8_ARAVE|nr:hypothetical protein AVEN_189712-1 [Araneus ventricosus]